MSTGILVVEDELIIRMVTVMHLSDEGFDVHEASDAKEAIAILETHPEIRLIFTDVNMPGSMDGLKLSAYVRSRWPPVQIVVTSGKQMVEITDLPDGSVFFSKPYQLDEVTSAMRQMLQPPGELNRIT